MKLKGSFMERHPGKLRAALKKPAVWLLICTMLLPGLVSACPGGTLKARAEEETEKKKETLYISTVEELVNLADLCHEDSWSRGLRVVLMNDLDLTGWDFAGIPIFNGTFQGQGYTISGYSYPGDGYVTGFFRYVGGDGVVQNLKLDAGIVAGEKDRCTGALAGINQGRIMDCSVLGSVSGYQETGAICGINQESGIILRCRNKGRVIGYYYTGGIAGKNFGMISRCTNEGYINDSIKWIQEDDEMNTDLMSSLTGDVKETISLQSGVDTGGICGYSDGVLTYCTNNGVVGYAHAGYNIGGIVGRQSGFSSNCSNKGKVYGKKDVGGICGQSEPYIEVDPGRSMKSSAEKLNAQIDRAIADAQDASQEVRNQLTAMQQQAQAVLDTTSAMTDQASAYVDEATDKVNETVGKVEKVVQTISENDPSTEEGQKKLEKEADDAIAKLEKKVEEDTKKAVEEGKKAEQEAEKEAKEAEEKAKKAAADKEGTKKQAEKTATEYIKKADQAWRDNADKLKGDLQSASDTMAQMNATAESYSEKLDADIAAIQNQVDGMNQMVYDLVQGVAEEGLDYVFADISEDAVDYTSRGILYNCANKGVVQGDTNAGGIVGAMDIDRENLENNVALTFRLQAGESYTLSVITADCTNDGFVSGRSDNIGGIAGYMRYGLLEKCYGYGLVESSGANVGGLAGYSRACIKDGYALCSLSGTTNVGGVCGYGKTIRECISMPVFLKEEGTCGAIAGQVERDDNTQTFSTVRIQNNYYAANAMYGIDDISYEGVAQTMDYDTLLEDEELPDRFRHLTVTFRAGEKAVGKQEMAFGSSLENLIFPDAPAKEGYYVRWEDVSGRTLNGNLVVTAEYVPVIPVIASGEKDTESGKVLGYLDGGFDDRATLSVTVDETLSEEGEEAALQDYRKAYKNCTLYHVSAKGTGEGPYAVRLYAPFKDAKVVLMKDPETGAWEETTFVQRGTYLECSLPEQEGDYLIAAGEELKASTVLLILGGFALLVAVLATLRALKKKRP